ncbi:MAG: hypothetical protein ABW298_08650 [Candidatus Binatia bacterium]
MTTIRPTVRFVIRYSPVMGSEVTDISFSERFGRDRSGWHGPAFLEDERLSVQGVSILDRGQVQHDSPEVPIAGLVGGLVVVADLLAIGFRSILSSHQAKHEIDVGALPRDRSSSYLKEVVNGRPLESSSTLAPTGSS